MAKKSHAAREKQMCRMTNTLREYRGEKFMNLDNLLSSDEKKRIADERKKRDNRYIDEKYYKGPYASRQMITGPQSKALLSMRTHGGDEAAKIELEQILEAEAILWPEKTRRLAHQKPETKTERKPTESRT